MRRLQVRFCAGLFTFGAFALLLLRSDTGETPVEAQQTSAGQPITMPGRMASVMISLGLKDEKVTDWKGTVTVAGGAVLGIDVAQGNPQATAKDGKFEARSIGFKMLKKKDSLVRPMLRVTLDAPESARIQVSTNHGDFAFTLEELAAGRRVFLEGQAAAVREDGSLRLTDGDVEHDYPALAAAPNGALWMASCEYRKGKPYVGERVLAGSFDDLVPVNNGDRIRLRKFDGKTWSAPIDATEGGLDIWRPSVVVDKKGTVHLFWSEQVAGNWDIYARSYAPGEGKWSAVKRLTDDPGTDFNVVAAVDARGDVWCAWQGWRDGFFRVFAGKFEANGQLSARKLTDANANHWSPTIAADSQGAVYVAYDTYEKENYDVHVARIGPMGVEIIPIAKSAKCEVRPSIACDKQDRLWIAYEEGDEQWGKDYSTNQFRKIGFDENPGAALYITRTVRVRCLENGKVMEPKGDLQKAMIAKSANNKSVARIAVDAAGAPWLLYRHHPKPLGAGEVWNSYALRYDGEAWSTPRRLVQSDNLMDNRPALAAQGQSLVAVYSGDARSKQQDRKRNDLFAVALKEAGPVKEMKLIAAVDPEAKMKSVHPNETEDVARMRAYRMAHDGKQLRLYRGEFHRHTEYTAHRDQDGLLEDSWRYALDAGHLDWMGNADHDNGHHDEYSWWQIQKTADLMHNAPAFTAIQSYERSNKYPNGHRNVILPKRGIRPLPRGNLAGDEMKGTPDTKILYKYLKHFGGMCSSHTSGTGMGTDWRDNDPIYEPVVEVYQGHRHNYEHFGAPRSATDKTQIGGYEPKGFIWHAFDKGYKLGFQASSDHVSTHMSYAIVLTDDPSRQGIIDAFKRRHSYAATDNIIVEFRCGKQIMGDIFESKRLPSFEIKVIGTAPVTKVSIIRDAKYLHVEEPKKKEVAITFTDNEAAAGKTSYYYVRVEQSDANLAWASPMWITYDPK